MTKETLRKIILKPSLYFLVFVILALLVLLGFVFTLEKEKGGLFVQIINQEPTDYVLHFQCYDHEGVLLKKLTLPIGRGQTNNKPFVREIYLPINFSLVVVQAELIQIPQGEIIDKIMGFGPGHAAVPHLGEGYRKALLVSLLIHHQHGQWLHFEELL